MSCSKSSVGLFEQVLIVNETVHTNLIQPKTTGNNVIVSGYTSQDDTIIASINASATLFAASNILYTYVADRSITVSAVSEIHRTPGQAGSQIRIYKRLTNGASVTLATGIAADSAANTTQSGTISVLNADLVKGESIYVSPIGDVSGLEGSVISFNLVVLA